MSAKVSRNFAFQAAIHIDNKFVINSYDIELSMDVQTEDPREQNIALDRIKYIFNECLENSIFVNHTETKVIEAYSKAGLRVCPVPEEPFDQIVAVVLLSKFNIITEQKLIIDQIKIKSLICDDVVFYISADEELLFASMGSGWWNDNNASVTDNSKKPKKEKIVDLKREPIDWNNIGLSWKEKPNKKENGEIVFIPMDK